MKQYEAFLEGTCMPYVAHNRMIADALARGTLVGRTRGGGRVSIVQAPHQEALETFLLDALTMIMAFPPLPPLPPPHCRR